MCVRRTSQSIFTDKSQHCAVDEGVQIEEAGENLAEEGKAKERTAC